MTFAMTFVASVRPLQQALALMTSVLILLILPDMYM